MIGGLRDAAYRAVDLLPSAISDRVLPGRRHEFATAGVAAVEEAGTRLFIGPVNSAGQGFAWARAAERRADTRAMNFMFRGPDDVFGFPADQVATTSCYLANRRWQRAQRAAVERGFTHVIVESGRPLVDGSGDPLAQIEALRAAGVRVALLWHGSDIRTPSSHAAREPDSPFRDGAYPDTELLETITSANDELIERAGLPVFVATPDLLADVPQATWVPVVVEPERWAAAAPSAALQRRRPVVVHAPSRAGLKGSDAIADAVHRLHDEAVIEYREARGIPAADMPAFYGEADVVLDQFLIGSYGVAACEAVAAGRLVVGHVAEDVRERVLAETGRSLPIVQARAAEVEHVLRRIAADPAHYTPLTTAGPDFVRTVHDGRRSAEAFEGFLSG